MSKLSWFVLNLILLVVAVVATGMVLRQDPGARWAPRPIPGLPETAAAGAGDGAVEPAAARVHRQLKPADLEDLWRRSLFCPARTEAVDEAGNTPATAAPVVAEFELVGIGVVGEVSAAIIVTQQARMAGAPVGRLPAGPGVRPTKTGGEKGQPAPREATKHVYLTGQAIGDTGYTLKEIRPGEVTVAKGAEERILKIERGDTASEGRSRAAADDESRRRVVEAAARPPEAPKPGERPAAGAQAAAATPPPPPPAPGAPGAPGGMPGGAAGRPPGTMVTNPATAAAAAATMSQEERIQRALEARRRILERRKETDGAPAGTTAPVP